MRHKYFRAATIAAISLTLVTSSTVPAYAQDSSFIPKPTAEHALLKKDVGTWDAVVKVWPVRGVPPIESKGTEKNELLPGDLWLVTHFDGEFAGTKFIGRGTSGYDPDDKKYVSTWIDTITPYLIVTKGEYDPVAKTLSGTAERRDPATGERYMTKQICRYMDDNHRTIEFRRIGKDGNDWKVMEIAYTRTRN